MRWVVTNSPSGHRSASSTSTSPPPSRIEPGGPRLGDPGAVDLALLEGGERVGVGLGHDRDVAAAGRVGLEALVGEPGPQGHVLGVAQRRRGQRGASRSATESISGLDDQERRRPTSCPSTMRSASPSDWAKPLIAGLGPMNVASMAPENRASIASVPALKVAVSSVHVVAQCLGEHALFEADDRRSVGDVGEVAEPEGDGLAADRSIQMTRSRRRHRRMPQAA